METAQIRFLRSVLGVTMKDKIRSEKNTKIIINRTYGGRH
jgi:hypothetical protein